MQEKYLVNKEKENITEDILFQYCNNDCNENRRKDIEQAIACSKELRYNAENIKTVLALDHDIKEYKSINTSAAYKKVSQQIKPRTDYRLVITRIAAIMSLPLLISTFALGYLYFQDDHTEDVIANSEIFTSPGTICRHELPDKSVVWLNSNSKLRYPNQLANNKTREVELEGEAYFEVHADKEHPFYVNTTNGMKVYAYGTKFNVNTYGDESFIEAVLEKGKINVIAPNQKNSIVLNPGESLIFDKATNRLKKSAIDIYEKTAWKEGKLIFRNTSLEDVLKKLSKFYNVDITFDNRSGKEYRYRATFTTEDITQILDYLSKSANLKWKMKYPEQKADSTFTRKQIQVTLYK